MTDAGGLDTWCGGRPSTALTAAESLPWPPVLGFVSTVYPSLCTAASPDPPLGRVLYWLKTAAKLLVGPWAHQGVLGVQLAFPVPKSESHGLRALGTQLQAVSAVALGRGLGPSQHLGRGSCHTLTSEAEAAPQCPPKGAPRAEVVWEIAELGLSGDLGPYT